MDQTIIDGHNLDRVFHIHPGSHLTLSDLTVQNGYMITGTQGGGIFTSGDLTLVNVKVTSNSMDGSSATTQGGGIMVYGAMGGIPSNVNIEGSIISDNEAEEGGGIYATDLAEITINNSQFLSNDSDMGGGILTYGSLGADAVVTITNSLFYTNTAAAGGGILNNGYLNLTNVTFSQNEAVNSASGGGILIGTNGRAELLNVTIYGSPNGTGLSNNNVVTMTNSILFNNLPFNCNINYPITSRGFNVSYGYHCNFSESSDLNHADPLLAPLADNGGPTRTHALHIESPALDLVLAGICPAQDQRGVSRPIDGNGDGTAYCDSGAYEKGELPNIYLPVILN